MKPTALVIGLGNTLRGDDAIGRVAADRVRQIADTAWVKVIDCSAATPELASEISQVERLVILDASVDGPIGEIVTRPLSESTSPHSMAHRLDASSLVGLSRQWYGRVPEAFAITFRGEHFDLRDCRLSPGAEAAVDQMVDETMRLIRMPPVDDSPGSD